MSGTFHQKVDVHCLYLPKKEDAQELISEKDRVKTKEKNLAKYAMEKRERLFKIVREGLEDGQSCKGYKKELICKKTEMLDEKI